jgi:hypothetical protein
VRVGGGRNAPSYLAKRRSIDEPDWQLITMAPLDPVENEATNAVIVTALVFVSLCLPCAQHRPLAGNARPIEPAEYCFVAPASCVREINSYAAQDPPDARNI